MGSIVDSLKERQVDIEVLKPPKVVRGTCCRLPLHSATAFWCSAASGGYRGILALRFDPELQQHKAARFRDLDQPGPALPSLRKSVLTRIDPFQVTILTLPSLSP
jgi:hypothetical protein